MQYETTRELHWDQTKVQNKICMFNYKMEKLNHIPSCLCVLGFTGVRFSFSRRFLYILFSSAHFVVIALRTNFFGTAHLLATVSTISSILTGSNLEKIEKEIKYNFNYSLICYLFRICWNCYGYV